MRHLQSEFHWIYSSKPEVSNGTAYFDGGKHIIHAKFGNNVAVRRVYTCQFQLLTTKNILTSCTCRESRSSWMEVKMLDNILSVSCSTGTELHHVKNRRPAAMSEDGSSTPE